MAATFAKYDSKDGKFNRGDMIVLNEEQGGWEKSNLAIQVIDGTGVVVHTTTDPEDAYWHSKSYSGNTKIGGEFLTALGRKRAMSVDNFYDWLLKAKGSLRNKGEDMYLAVTNRKMGVHEFEMRGGW